MHVVLCLMSHRAFCFACSYGMRYIAKVLKNSLHEKFPDASEDELMKVEALKSINIYFSTHSTVYLDCPLYMLYYCEHAEVRAV